MALFNFFNLSRRLSSGNLHSRARKNSFLFRLEILALRFGLPICAGIFAVLVGILSFKNWPYLHQELDQKLSSFSMHTGLVVQDIEIVGRQRTERQRILDIIGLKLGMPLLTFDPVRAQTNLESFPWIRDVRIERHFPDTVFIQLTEHQPMALWQYNQKLFLIDENGNVLTDQNLGDFSKLPLLVGENAPQNGKALFTELVKYPLLWQKVDTATWVGNRRWDLRLSSGTVIRLPEENMPETLSKFVSLDKEHKIL